MVNVSKFKYLYDFLWLRYDWELIPSSPVEERSASRSCDPGGLGALGAHPAGGCAQGAANWVTLGREPLRRARSGGGRAEPGGAGGGRGPGAGRPCPAPPCADSGQPPALARTRAHTGSHALTLTRLRPAPGGVWGTARPRCPRLRVHTGSRPFHIPQAGTAPRSQHHGPAGDAATTRATPSPFSPWTRGNLVPHPLPGAAARAAPRGRIPVREGAGPARKPRPLAPRPRLLVPRLPIRSQSAAWSTQTGPLPLRDAGLGARDRARAPPPARLHVPLDTGADTQPASLAWRAHLHRPGASPPAPPARAPAQTPRGRPAPSPGCAGRAYSPQELDLVLAVARVGHGSAGCPAPLAPPPLPLRPPLPRAARRAGRRGPSAGALRAAEAEGGRGLLRCAEGDAGTRARRTRSGECSAGAWAGECAQPEAGWRAGAERGRRAGPWRLVSRSRSRPGARASAAYWPRRVSSGAPGARSPPAPVERRPFTRPWALEPRARGPSPGRGCVWKRRSAAGRTEPLLSRFRLPNQRRTLGRPLLPPTREFLRVSRGGRSLSRLATPRARRAAFTSPLHKRRAGAGAHTGARRKPRVNKHRNGRREDT